MPSAAHPRRQRQTCPSLSGCCCQSTAVSRCVQRAISQKDGGDGRDRTDDLMLAKQLLSQLSYVP